MPRSIEDGAAKAWCTINASGALEPGTGTNSFNTASVTDTDTGDRLWIFDTDFADSIWTAVATTDATVSHVFIDGITASQIHIATETSGGSLADRRSRQAAFGNQA